MLNNRSLEDIEMWITECGFITFSSIVEFADDGERYVRADSNHLYHFVVLVSHHTDAIHLVEVEKEGRREGR